MAWILISEDCGWVLWNGEAYHENLGGSVVRGAWEDMSALADWLNRGPEHLAAEAAWGISITGNPWE